MQQSNCQPCDGYCRIKAIQGYTRVPAGDEDDVCETKCQVYRIVKKATPLSTMGNNTTASRGVSSSFSPGGRELRRSLSADSKLSEKAGGSPGNSQRRPIRRYYRVRKLNMTRKWINRLFGQAQAVWQFFLFPDHI